MSLLLTIYTPNRTLFEKEKVERVILPTLEGEVEILPDYVHFLGGLDTGRFFIEKSSGECVEGILTTGFFEVADGEVRVVAEVLETREEIDVDRAQEAQKKAEEGLLKGGYDTFEKYERKWIRSLLRQSLGRGKSS